MDLGSTRLTAILRASPPAGLHNAMEAPATGWYDVSRAGRHAGFYVLS